ncbi:hypothetical protein L8S13_03935 [Vibrio lentus]|uniref:hypothetical protein n=1 Tax=Vibrio lentus TaxID=136468 RepID=UPI0024694DAC|nr:hypothetical protein [Vibrio lentus]MDH5925429.1 hypothetical protein [Vibrio lentus]
MNPIIENMPQGNERNKIEYLASLIENLKETVETVATVPLIPKLPEHPTVSADDDVVVYFNTTDKHFYGFNGAEWRQLDNEPLPMVARYLWATSYFQLKTKGRIYRNDEISFSFQAPNANEFYCATDELLIMSPNITILRDGAVYGSQVGNFAETMPNTIWYQTGREIIYLDGVELPSGSVLPTDGKEHTFLYRYIKNPERPLADDHLDYWDTQYSLMRVNIKAWDLRYNIKDVIENNDGYRVFYHDGKAIAKEDTVQRIFRLTWYASPFDVNAEVNNGRGPADYKVSFGSGDSTIVEFKLASSSSLKANLKHQTEIYKKASKSIRDIKVILCYTAHEIFKVRRILKGLGEEFPENVVVIDATRKTSASKVV